VKTALPAILALAALAWLSGCKSMADPDKSPGSWSEKAHWELNPGPTRMMDR